MATRGGILPCPALLFDKPYQRHATLTTIAPTGHISTLAGCSSSIEPYYLLEYDRLAAGVLQVKNQIYRSENLRGV
jgi:ribonucleotide reductase alpha subunit